MKMKNNLIKSMLIMLIFVFALNNVFSTTSQEKILYWDFEEGAGNIAIDNSNNNLNGIFYSNVYYTTSSKFGGYGVGINGGNDYIETFSSNLLPSELTISYWISPWTNNDDTILNIYNSNLMNFGFNFKNNGDKYFWYYDNSNVYQSVVLFNGLQSYNYNNFVYTIDFINETIKTYYNNVLMNTNQIPNINYDNSNYYLRVGLDKYNNGDYSGNFDELKLFKGVLNTTQINDLYTNTPVTLYTEPVLINDTTIDNNLINSTSPTIDLISNSVEFSINLNTQANCQFYLDNQLKESFNNIFATSFNNVLDDGEHSYFWYCSYMENNNLKYQLSNIINFNITKPDTTITFNIHGNDFNVNDESLYITTPCPQEGFSAIGYEVGYSPKYNTNGIYWEKVINGVATLNTTADIHEFCLFNGRVIVNDEGNSINYDVVSKNGILELGNIEIPSTLNPLLNINVDKFEIYDISNPKAYNESWSTLSKGIIMLLLGGLLTFIGIKAESKVMVLIGGTLLLGAFGVSMSGIVGLINL